jgi:CHAT domain-containing protein
LLESSTRNLPNDYLRCVRLSQLADAYQGAKLYQKALATYQISLPACRGQKNTEATLNALDGSASAELALGRYDDALHDSQEALALIESIRKQLVQKDAYKQGYLEQTLDMYNTAIDALTALGRATEALETAEQARSRALLDLLGTHSAALPASHAVSASDDASLLESSTQAPPASMKDIVDSLQRLHSTLLAYWSSQTSLHIWVVTEKGEVFQATRKITPRQISSMQGHRRLYRELIEPMKEHLPKGDNELLTIVPSGPLFNISFAALQGPNGKYLVEQYRTHVLPSIGLLRFTSRNAAESERQNERYVLLADPASPPDRLPSLPSTRVEATAIARILPPAQTSLLLGAEANRRQLLDNISSATVLHMATHAVLNEKDSYQSFLALQSGRTDTGKLTVADIYQWKLHSRLVVLSACRSGLGRITGDGIAGLNRALFYAGAASVLSSMWDIADKPTAEMLPRFYQALLTGTSPSGALRQAQLSMLSDLRKGRIHVRTIGASSALPPDPVYWAAFSLAGEP